MPMVDLNEGSSPGVGLSVCLADSIPLSPHCLAQARDIAVVCARVLCSAGREFAHAHTDRHPDDSRAGH
jgi:hypothetical protein